jgi:hypothetical protein
MASERTILTPVNFAFEFAGGWARASISNGTDTYSMEPSYVLNDPLFGLLQAVVEIVRNGGDNDTGCEWWYEPALDRWALHREGDSLRITIRGRRHGFPNSSIFTSSRFWSSELGTLKFTATCDLWKFAAKVRLAVSRLAPIGQDDPTCVQRTAEYRALCDFLEEHKHIPPPTSGKLKR